jgi:hypothetical protein
MNPENFWSTEHFTAAEGTPLIMASAAATPFAKCGRVFEDNQSLLRCVCSLNGALSREFFSCLLFQIIVSFKWMSFGRRRCSIRLLRYLGFQLLLVLLSSSFATETSSGNRNIALFACIASVLPLSWEIHHIVYHAAAALRECSTQKSWGLKSLGLRFRESRYFKDFWNIYDVTRAMFTIASVGAVAANSQSHSAWLLSIAMYLRWLGLLFFLMPFESTGPLIRMIFQIAYGIRCVWRLMHAFKHPFI